jgi:restriction system protein
MIRLAQREGKPMPNEDTVVWGIHGGRTGDADSLFLKKNVVAIGWAKIGDLAKLKP